MIVVHELVKRFHWAGQEITAVDHVSFEVGAGEVFGLLGPNGAGKTTTLRMVMGLMVPDSGYTEIDQIRTGPDSAAVRAKIGMVSTNDGVYPWLSVREMLLYFADLYDIAPTVAEERLRELSAALALGGFMHQRCSTLSTGQRQRVILARGLIHDPPVMLLDEPTRGLDVVGSQTVFEFIARLKASGKAVVLSTHRLDEAERACDRFGLLHRGRLLHTGSLSELQQAIGERHLTDMFLKIVREQPAVGEVPVA